MKEKNGKPSLKRAKKKFRAAFAARYGNGPRIQSAANEMISILVRDGTEEEKIESLRRKAQAL